MRFSLHTVPSGDKRWSDRLRSLTRSSAAIALLTASGLSVLADEPAQDLRPANFRSTNSSVSASRIDSLRETPVVTAIRRAAPAVVNLHGQKMVRGSAASMAGAVVDPMRQVNGMGTGVVIDPRGYVITNYHVVEDVAEINVTMHDGRNTRADLIASDPASDLALVRVRSNDSLPTIPRGRSDDLMIGETVIAIGNAFGYVHTSTLGIISALHRDIPVNETQQYRDLIQTSAGINPGNSGGPLLNIDGEMIGVNVAVRVGAQQIAFAIPIDQVLDTVTRMVQRDNDRRVSIGMESGPDSRGGLRVTSVVAGGAADRCGLKRGDRVTSVNNQPTSDSLQFALTVLEGGSAENLRLEFDRDDQTFETYLATTASTEQFSDSVAAAVWQVIGITVRPAGDAMTRKVNTRMKTNYRGGLIVADVRPGSAADQQGIIAGDLLLGIHSWQTATVDDLAGILDQPEIRRGSKAKFYLIRRDQTLYGHLQLAAQTNPLARR